MKGIRDMFKKKIVIISILIAIVLGITIITSTNNKSEKNVKQVSKLQTENTIDDKNDISESLEKEEAIQNDIVVAENKNIEEVENKEIDKVAKVNSNNDDKKSLNVQKTSDEFIEDYFNEYKEMQEENNKENILIINSAEKIVDSHGATKIVEAPNNQYFLQYDSEEEKNNAIEKFNKEEQIVSVEENIIHKALENEKENLKEDENINQEKIVETHGKNDTNKNTINKNVENKRYNSWGIKAMGLDNAPEIVGNNEANEVTVAIIDTGCDMELFNKNYSGKIVETYNVLDPEGEMVDTDGHGTHIAGTIAEGTPSNVKILPVKVAVDGQEMYTTDIITAINYIVQNKKADVINMSYGAYETSTAEQLAIEAAKNENIICVAAAGNENTNMKCYPSALSDTISVAACDYYLKRANFSNYGDTITFCAPGVEILSINGEFNGTSMATPHIVNSVAILKSHNKNYSLSQIIDELKNYTIDLGDEGWDEYYGWGFISFNGPIHCDECECEDCNGIVCTCSDKIEVDGEIQLTNYNYGNITNLNPTRLNVIKGLKTENIGLLNFLDNHSIAIANKKYNPYSKDIQTINISYEDIDLTLNIDTMKNHENAWEYEILENNTIKLTGMKEEENSISILGIPEYIDGHTVTEIDFEMSSKIKEELKKVIIGSEFKKIGDNVFKDCINLEKITGFAQAMSAPLELGNYAFSGCSRLNLYNEPYDISEIGILGIGTFENCTSLTFENIGFSSNQISCDRIPNKCFKGCTAINGTPSFEGVKYIGEEAFMNCINIGHIYTSAETIDKKAFAGCLQLNYMYFSEGVKNIRSNAFLNCGLEYYYKMDIVIPSTVEFIAEDAFINNSFNSVDVNKNNNVYTSKIINNDGTVNPFYAIIEKSTNKLILGSIKTAIPETVTSIGDYAFYGIKRSDIVIPDGVQTIGEKSFAKSSKLNTVTIPKSVKNIGEQAFLDIEDSVILKVYSNSYAHNYAINNNIKYELIDAGVKISGNVKSFGNNESEKTTIQLIKEGEETPCKTLEVLGTQSNTYEMLNVLEGKYTIKVIKNNHVTREYTITVETEDIEQDLIIYLLGDVTGDGAVTAKDLNRLYFHVNGTKPLEDYECKCGDIIVDGLVTAKDLNRLYFHINGTKLIY